MYSYVPHDPRKIPENFYENLSMFWVIFLFCKPTNMGHKKTVKGKDLKSQTFHHDLSFVLFRFAFEIMQHSVFNGTPVVFIRDEVSSHSCKTPQHTGFQ